MVSQKKYHLLLWMIAILVATNLSTIGSFMYHKNQEGEKEPDQTQVEMPNEQRTRFFREQLDLSFEQVDSFRVYNRAFNRAANQVTNELENLRLQMVEEMGKDPVDHEKLKQITTTIGTLHTKLKDITIDYYIQMKEACTAEQAEKLNNIFRSILDKNDQMKPAQHMGRGRNRK